MIDITVNGSDLRPELSLVSSLIYPSATIPVLRNVLLEAGDWGLRLTATDLDETLQATVAAEVESPGSVTIDGKRFLNIVKNLPDHELRIREGEAGFVTLASGRSRFKLATLPAEQFPEVDLPPTEPPISTPSDTLQSAIRHTTFAVDTEPGRYPLSSVHIESSPLRLVATDTHRLAIYSTDPSESDTAESEDPGILVSPRALSIVARMVDGIDVVEISHSPNLIYFRSPGHLLSARKNAGTFPTYRHVVPSESSLTITVKNADVLNALNRVLIVSDLSSHAVVLTIEKNTLKIESQNDTDEGHDVIVVDETSPNDHEPLTIGFNGQYLLDYFKAVKTTHSTLSFKTSKDPVLIRPDRYSYQYVVMPMRA